jgi:hypothetical protein
VVRTGLDLYRGPIPITSSRRARPCATLYSFTKLKRKEIYSKYFIKLFEIGLNEFEFEELFVTFVASNCKHLHEQ